MKQIRCKTFANGRVYALQTDDGYPIETTDTFLPYYTKDAIGRKQNRLADESCGSRADRWMIGVSTMSGCPVHCRFCATGKLKRWRNLTAAEIVAQVEFIVDQNPRWDPAQAQEFKINYTRMGEPFLNLDNVRAAIAEIDRRYPRVHHYVSTIGVRGSDFTWVRDNVTLQLSLHAMSEDRRNWLIPYSKKLTVAELGQIRTQSNLKTTLNLTLVEQGDFDLQVLKAHFDPQHFFVKLSPINPNEVSEGNELGEGCIEGRNLR